MTSMIFIKKIRYYSFFSFILPLVALNLCLVLYYHLGILKIYKDVTWDNKQSVFNLLEYSNSENRSYTNCPKYKVKNYYIRSESGKKFESSNENFEKYIDLSSASKKYDLVFDHSEDENQKCIKNHFLANLVVVNLNLDQFFIKIKDNYKPGFGEIKNPYLYGEVSISRTARYFPANIIFKPLILLGSILLFFYWLNNLRFLKSISYGKSSIKFSNKFFYIGILSCLFLALHVIFLGIEYDAKLYKVFRKSVIMFFILFEVIAQLLLTINLVKLSSILKNYINSTILKIKVAYVAVVALVTLISFGILIFLDTSSSFNHILEWNYFGFLLIYYLLSSLLWKSLKP